MWLDDETPICKQNLILLKPFVNSPGSLGFAPDRHTMPFLDHLGAFITHPISRLPRTPAENRCCLPFPGGFLLHTGLPNPGISRAITRFKRQWAGSHIPVIVNLLVETPETLVEMIRKLEGLENVLAVELGLPPECDLSLLMAMIKAAQGELPVILCLRPEQIPTLLNTVEELQVTAVHLMPPRGILPNAKGDLVSGSLYGPAFFPQTLSASKAIINSDLSLIAGCGAFHAQQIQILLEIGTTAVSLHAAIWQINSARLFEK